jgi:hypothetical protein
MALRALASNAGLQWGLRTQFGLISRAFSSGARGAAPRASQRAVRAPYAC